MTFLLLQIFIKERGGLELARWLSEKEGLLGKPSDVLSSSPEIFRRKRISS